MGLSYNIVDRKGKPVVELIGSVDENSENVLRKIHDAVKGDCEINFKGVEIINSQGIMLWIEFFDQFQIGRNVVFTECPSDVVIQINMIPRFLGSAKIGSFYCNFICRDCECEESVIMKTEDGYENLSSQCLDRKCTECGGELELDEDRDSYFGFTKSAS